MVKDRNDLSTRIAQATDLEPAKVAEVVQLALEELHRITIVDEKGPTSAVMEACFSFGGEAAFHLIGLYASEHNYYGRDDDAGVWAELAKRFIPTAYAEGCERIAPWFAEKTAARLRLDTACQDRSAHAEHMFAEKPPRTGPKTFRPAGALAMARASIGVGRKHGDKGLLKAGRKLLEQTNESLKSGSDLPGPEKVSGLSKASVSSAGSSLAATARPPGSRGTSKRTGSAKPAVPLPSSSEEAMEEILVREACKGIKEGGRLRRAREREPK